MLAGLSAIVPAAFIQMYCAWAPKPRPSDAKTWSPFLNRVTALPTASISRNSSRGLDKTHVSRYRSLDAWVVAKAVDEQTSA